MSVSLAVLFAGIGEEGIAPLLGVLGQEGGYAPEWRAALSAQELDDALRHSWDVVIADHSDFLPIGVVAAALHARMLDMPLLVVSASQDYRVLSEVLHAGVQGFVARDSLHLLVPAIDRELRAARQRAEQRTLVVADSLLQEIDRLILQGHELRPLEHRICERIIELFGFSLVWTGMKQPDGSVEVAAAAGAVAYLNGIDIRWDDTPQGRGTTGQAIRSGRPVVLEGSAPDFAAWSKRAEPFGIRRILSLPLKLGGEVIGVMSLYSGREQSFDESETERLMSFASRVSVAIMVAREQQQLRMLSAAMNNAPNAIFITDLEGAIEWHNDALERFSGFGTAEVLGSNPRIFGSGLHDQAFWQRLWQTILHGRVWRGDITNRHKNGSQYVVTQNISPLRNSSGKLTHFLAIQQDISERKRLEEEIQKLAYYDTLTSLPNRAMFEDRLQLALLHAEREREGLALLFLDLDGFKDVNDNHGHAAGDRLLRTVAERIRSCVRAGDTAARLGGDEFTLLLPGVSCVEHVAGVADKVLKCVAEPYRIDGEHDARVTVSIGVCIYPADGEDADTLMIRADKAMYRAKQGGKNNIEFWGAAGQAALDI